MNLVWRALHDNRTIEAPSSILNLGTVSGSSADPVTGGRWIAASGSAEAAETCTSSAALEYLAFT